MNAVEIAVDLIKRFEGVRLSPYLCPAGIPTCGIGATFYEDGTRVTLRDAPITRERAEALLMWHVKTIYLPAVASLCPGADTPERIAALIDFAFNLGAGNLKASTLRRKVNAGDWEGARRELARWNKSGGRELRGLTLRRAAEAALENKIGGLWWWWWWFLCCFGNVGLLVNFSALTTTEKF